MTPAIREKIAALPGDAWGFVMARPDRQERRALYDRDGALQATFAQGDDFGRIHTMLAIAGFCLDADWTVRNS